MQSESSFILIHIVKHIELQVCVCRCGLSDHVELKVNAKASMCWGVSPKFGFICVQLCTGIKILFLFNVRHIVMYFVMFEAIKFWLKVM